MVTRDLRLLQPGENPAEHRNKIVAIESTISTTMPDDIGLTSLEEFSQDLIEAIICIRTQHEPCTNGRMVQKWLEKAKIPLQLAKDECKSTGNNQKRYQRVGEFCEMLREALIYW